MRLDSNIKFEIKLKTLFTVSIIILLIYLTFRLNDILTPFALSFFIAYLMEPIISKAEKYKLPRSIAVIIIFIVLIGLIGSFLLILIPMIYREIYSFGKDLPEYIDRLSPILNELQAKLNFDLSTEKVKDLIISKGSELSKMAYKTIGTLTSSIKSIVGSVILYSIVPILIFYFSKDYKYVTESLIKIIQENSNFNAKKYIDEFNQILSSYFRGQFIVAMILGILYSIVLLITGIKPALIVGLSAGVLSIIPYLGFVVGFGVSLILAYLQYFDIWHPLFVLAGFAIVQTIESNFITPKIVGSKLGLHPTAVIFALLAGGSLLGIAGMIFSLPIAAAIKVWLNKIITTLKR
jgi:predicted PurR-regulated permease PerM